MPALIKTLHNYRGYAFSIAYYPEDPAWSVDYPDIPAIITSGESLTKAFANACEALDLHLESLQKLGKKLPRRRHRVTLTRE